MRGVRGWNLVALLVGEVLADPYSHLNAAALGWAYAPNPSDVLFLNWVDAQAQMNHRSGKVPPKPVARPWEASRAPQRSMPDPARFERRAALMARLGLRGVVDADNEPDGQPETDRDD